MDIYNTLIFLPGVIIGLTVHEFAHAYTAYLLGDNTAKDNGRISLNPLKHIDWLGFILIIIMGFGWAKPVSFNPNNLKKKHRDEILISIAGPFSNLILACIFIILIEIFVKFNLIVSKDSPLLLILFVSGQINVGLAFFNMLPIPPLDGSHLYLTFLQKRNPELMIKFYRFGMWGLFMLIMLDNFTHLNILNLSGIIRGIYDLLFRIINSVF
jgi:Zn-dependent protease